MFPNFLPIRTRYGTVMAYFTKEQSPDVSGKGMMNFSSPVSANRRIGQSIGRRGSEFKAKIVTE